MPAGLAVSNKKRFTGLGMEFDYLLEKHGMRAAISSIV